MTVSSTVYKADSTGNGVTTEFTIPFDLQDESQVLVTKVSAAGVETVLVLNTDYTVSGVGTASRKITLTTALPTGERVIRSPNISLTQSVDYVEGDDFPAETHEAAIDKLTLICQQLQEQLNRTVKLDISDAVDIDALITNIQTVAENLTNLNIVAGVDTEITAVAAIDSAVSTLAAISSDISAVSAVASDVTGVAAIDTDVTAVAAISAAISTLNGIASDISAVAGVSGDVTTVAGISANVTTVAGLETEILAVPGQAQAAADSAAAAATFDPALYLAKASADMSGNGIANLASLNGGPMGGFRNKIINGDFDIWQRATSQTLNDYGSVDRWRVASSGSTKTFSQQTFTLGQTDVPGNPTYYSRNVISSVAGAGNFAILSQRIEGVKTLSGKTATLTFYAKADAAKNMAVELSQSFGTSGSPSSDVNEIGAQLVALTTSWQKFSVTITIPSISGKTLGSDGNDSLQVFFWFDSGSTYNSRTASLGQQSGTFDIAHVSIVEGDATQEDDPFEPRLYQQELALCHWFFERKYYENGYGISTGQAYNASTALADLYYKYKRSEPSITLNGTIIFLNNSAGDAGGTLSIAQTNQHTARINLAGASGISAGSATTLYAGSSGCYIDIDAEI